MNYKKKIFFFGTPEISVPALRKLTQIPGVEIVGVGVFPDKKVGRLQVLMPCSVKVAAKKLGLRVFEIAEKKDLKEIFEKEKFDLGVVIAFGMIFPKEILNIPEYGVVNVHFSLLPKYRGASPVQAAILNGDRVSGITFQCMVRKLDAGDVLYQKEYDITDNSTSEVWADFAQKTAEMMPAFLESYFSGKIKPEKQDRRAVSFCRKFAKQDGEIFPQKETARAIYQKYLAFDVFPGVFISTKKGNVKLTKVSLKNKEGAAEIECSEGTRIYVLRAQVPGKKEMEVGEILRGNPGVFSDQRTVSNEQ